jgi:glycerol-3-phosphate acyltransferase PlsY
MEGVAALLAAYLLGSLPFAYWAARARGVDIFTVGTGNPGAANVFRVVSRPLGVLVLLLDIFKGFAAVGVGRLVGLGEGWLTALGAAAVLGHAFSPFLRLRGGAGLATAVGASLGISPLITGMAWIGGGLVLPLLRNTGYTAGIGVVLFVALSLLLRQGWLPTVGPVLLFVLVLLVSRLKPLVIPKRP